MYGGRAAVIVLLGAMLASCRGLMPSALSGGNSACGDPCATMVCPSGDRCVWDSGTCAPRCEPTPMPNNFNR